MFDNRTPKGYIGNKRLFGTFSAAKEGKDMLRSAIENIKRHNPKTKILIKKSNRASGFRSSPIKSIHYDLYYGD